MPTKKFVGRAPTPDGFVDVVLKMMEKFKEVYDQPPGKVIIREAFFEGLQAEFEAQYGAKERLKSINNVPLERASKFARWDIQMVHNQLGPIIH